MRIGVLGSGPVGQTIGAGLAQRAHDVVVGTRHPDKLQDWVVRVGNRARVGSFADAAAHGEIIFLHGRGEFPRGHAEHRAGPGREGAGGRREPA